MNLTIYVDSKLFLKEGLVVGPQEEIVQFAIKLGNDNMYFRN